MITWEEAVESLRRNPQMADLVRDCYYDDPLAAAAGRFAASEEWEVVRSWLPRCGNALEIGAGRGIASWALSREGWKVTALEPDPSEIVGAGAIRALSRSTGVAIEVVENWGESLPFADSTFDLVYGRAVFHHAADLDKFCKEGYRVLRPGGRMVLTREHVLSSEEDLGRFLDLHPLHHLYGGEAAYTLDRYLEALRSGGFRTVQVVGPKSSPVNYFPEKKEAVERALKERRRKRLGKFRSAVFGILGETLAKEAVLWEKELNWPGRLYSFLADKQSSR